MRRERFAWSFLVIGVLLVLYGGFFMFYYNQKNQSIFVSAIIAFAIGLIMLIGYSILYLLSHKKHKQVVNNVEEEEIKEDEEIKEEDKVVEDKPKPSIYKYDDIEYVSSSRSSSSIYDSYTSYVRKVGYGPILEINGNRIKDMRNNIYYRNEKGKIYQDGGGLIYDISANRIRSIYGNQLYEISGNNINKVFGGYYASISGNYLTKYDGSEKYELGDAYSSNMLLLIAVLVFGE